MSYQERRTPPPNVLANAPDFMIGGCIERGRKSNRRPPRFRIQTQQAESRIGSRRRSGRRNPLETQPLHRRRYWRVIPCRLRLEDLLETRLSRKRRPNRRACRLRAFHRLRLAFRPRVPPCPVPRGPRYRRLQPGARVPCLPLGRARAQFNRGSPRRLSLNRIARRRRLPALDGDGSLKT
jgi:hypothetical protein